MAALQRQYANCGFVQFQGWEIKACGQPEPFPSRMSWGYWFCWRPGPFPVTIVLEVWWHDWCAAVIARWSQRSSSKSREGSGEEDQDRKPCKPWLERKQPLTEARKPLVVATIALFSASTKYKEWDDFTLESLFRKEKLKFELVHAGNYKVKRKPIHSRLQLEEAKPLCLSWQHCSGVHWSKYLHTFAHNPAPLDKEQVNIHQPAEIPRE